MLAVPSQQPKLTRSVNRGTDLPFLQPSRLCHEFGWRSAPAPQLLDLLPSQHGVVAP